MLRQLTWILFLTGAAGTVNADTHPATYGHQTTAAETSGILGGMALGGLIGGPPGLIAGAAIGALLGDGYTARRSVNELQLELYESHLVLTQLQAERDALLQAQSAVIPAPRIQAVSTDMPRLRDCCDNTVVAVYFRPDSSDVESHDREVLDSFVRLSRQMSDPAIEITGFADRTGDAQHNLQLSQRRSLAVRDYLAAQGLSAAHLTTVAYGESRPLQPAAAPGTDFFDRRVLLRLRDARQSMLTQSED